MGRESDIFSLYPETITMAAGTSHIFKPIAGQIAATIKYGSGGTLYFLGATASLGSSFATAYKYPLGINEIFNFDCAGEFSIEVQGATTIFYVLRSRSAGFPQT